jgi:hypothetical protein
MKFYETHYEEYLNASENANIHPELEQQVIEKLPKNIRDFGNLIVYGPSGVGKYTQVLRILKKYSPSNLKYDKKIKIQTDKQNYIYRISDIHYEIDMSLLGCNSKIIWFELFQQIVDIISIKTEKCGIIVCKNFHCIHTELLEIFYSYIQQYNHRQSNIQIRYIIISEHISFLPNNILNCCKVVSVKRPNKENYVQIAKNGLSANFINTKDTIYTDNKAQAQFHFTQRISNLKKNRLCLSNTQMIMENIDTDTIMNAKEVKSFSLLNHSTDIPSDIFNIICNNIIDEIEHPEKIAFTNFRDVIYDILIYNLDVTECIWYILNHFITKRSLDKKSISEILTKTHSFLKYYNNNYRPIYHLESIFFYIIIKVHQYEYKQG